MDLKTISQLSFQSGFDEFKRPTWQPRAAVDFEKTADIWTLLREKSVIVFHPYESFDAVVQFVEAAAADPDVLAIKQTLYRTHPNSAVVPPLERAALKRKGATPWV